MEKISKKITRNAIHDALQQVLAKLELSNPSKKTKKVADNLSRKFSARIVSDIKKRSKKVQKEMSATDKKSKDKKTKKIVVAA